jgi:hypothetical protein
LRENISIPDKYKIYVKNVNIQLREEKFASSNFSMIKYPNESNKFTLVLDNKDSEGKTFTAIVPESNLTKTTLKTLPRLKEDQEYPTFNTPPVNETPVYKTPVYEFPEGYVPINNTENSLPAPYAPTVPTVPTGSENYPTFRQEGGKSKTTRKKLDKLTVVELKEKAKNKKIKGYSKMNKSELINILRSKK